MDFVEIKPPSTFEHILADSFSIFYLSKKMRSLFPVPI